MTKSQGSAELNDAKYFQVEPALGEATVSRSTIDHHQPFSKISSSLTSFILYFKLD
jgi:hypothetical protein